MEDEKMGNVHFTKEQIERLRQNPYVKNVSEKSISYSDEFREEFARQHCVENKAPSVILRGMGFDTKVLGRVRINSVTARIRKMYESGEDLRDKRTWNSGRPATRVLTEAERIGRLEQENAYLRQENEFLKKSNLWRERLSRGEAIGEIRDNPADDPA